MPKAKELGFIVGLGLILIFFGLAERTTIFFFPNFGSKIYGLISFYTLATFGALALTAIVYQNTKQPVPNFPWYIAIAKFVPAYIIFHLFFAYLLGAKTTALPLPALNQFIQETLVSFQENVFGLVLLPYILSVRLDQGSYTKVIGIRIPDIQKIVSYVPSTLFVTLLHLGSYSQTTSTINQLYIALFINFILFMTLKFVLDTLGFGVSEGMHAGWNTAIDSMRGSMI